MRQKLARRKSKYPYAWSGGKRHSLYVKYHNMLTRCLNPTSKQYVQYGARGVVVSDIFQNDYSQFLQHCGAIPDPAKEPAAYNKETPEFMGDALAFHRWFRRRSVARTPTALDLAEWADLNGKEREWWKRISLDRIRNEDDTCAPMGYVPGNIRLIPISRQSVNRRHIRTVDGVPELDIARAAGLKTQTVNQRARTQPGKDRFRKLDDAGSRIIDRAIHFLLVHGKIRVAADGRIVDLVKNKPLLPNPQGGYLRVKLPVSYLSDLEEFKTLNRLYVHAQRVVAIAFHGLPPEGKTQVDHINKDKYDNRAFNLRWVDAEENSANRGKAQPGSNSMLDWYKALENYDDLLLRRSAGEEINRFEPNRIMEADHVQELCSIGSGLTRLGWVIGSQAEFLYALASAPKNEVRRTDRDSLELTVFTGKRRAPKRVDLTQLRGTHRVHLGCIACGFESESPVEVREVFQGRQPGGKFDYHCEWCASLALTKPNVARYAAEESVGGTSPYKLPAGSSKRALFNCRYSDRPIAPCMSHPLKRIVKKLDQPPICEECRMLERYQNLCHVHDGVTN